MGVYQRGCGEAEGMVDGLGRGGLILFASVPLGDNLEAREVCLQRRRPDGTDSPEGSAGALPGVMAPRLTGWRAVVRGLRSTPRVVLNDLVTTLFPADCRCCGVR